MSHSRPGAVSRFSSKGAFDALPVEDVPSDEEEAVIVEQEAQPVAHPSPQESTKPPTKSQLKKAARQARRDHSSAPSSSAPQSAKQETFPLSSEQSPLRGDTRAGPATPPKSNTNALSRGPTSALPAPLPMRTRSRSPPSNPRLLAEPSFTPTLPTDLPRPPPPMVVRKRKASTSLSPNRAKESKVEVQRENAKGDTVTTTIPVSVEVTSSSKNVLPPKPSRWANALPRAISGFTMIGGFCLLLAMGHVYMICLVLFIQSLVYREISVLFRSTNDPWSNTLNWYFFAVANYFLYGETIIYYFKHVVFSDALFLPFATNHRFISFMLYMFGFMGFVGSLKKNYLRRQFSLFGWVHMTLLVIVLSSHFIVDNILEGMIWFWVPASLVICNDVFAYVWGITLGRTQLFALSPKKTVEGFVGALFSTLIFGFLWGSFWMRYEYMICPVKDLSANAWHPSTCKPNDVFVWRHYELMQPAAAVVSFLCRRTVESIPWAPYQFHVLVMACFASLVAPFGGFFASGFKRAFNVKDFGQSIPGHGGMTDRMDCQFLMGMFSYVYYSNLIRVHAVTVGSVLQTIANGLSTEDQWLLVEDLTRLLEGRSTLTDLRL